MIQNLKNPPEYTMRYSVQPGRNTKNEMHAVQPGRNTKNEMHAHLLGNTGPLEDGLYRFKCIKDHRGP